MPSENNDPYHGIPRILMFSDIEGCQKHNAPKPNLEVKQSGFLCNPAFYAEIRSRLEGDDKLHVAFLGDYFDQGMGVYDSITGMYGLLIDFPKQVHVILGNRDVNKLRFCFELAKKDEVVGIPNGQTRWGVWGKFHDGLESKKNDEVTLVNHILFESMGAKIDMNTNDYNPAPNAKLIGLHSFLPSSLSDEKKQDSKLALEYLKVSLGIKPRDEVTTPGALDLLGFFKKCKIAHVFDGTLGKVLLAHGGGFDPEAFFDQAYVDSFGVGVKDITPQNYHSTLEQFRRKLSGVEISPIPINGGARVFNRKAANDYGNNASNKNMRDRTNRGSLPNTPLPVDANSESTSGPSLAEILTARNLPADNSRQILETSIAVEESVNAYNKLLKEVLDEVSRKEFTWKFVLLQALGLKPDVDSTNTNNDARYKSLIQSCSQDGCKGPNAALTSDPNISKLAKILTDSGITHVSYGHKPICFPIPVIYRRREIDGVTFISNDTSNGNRKVDEIGENTAIGTMVIFDANKKLVQSKIEPVELKEREAKVGDYSAMYDPLTLQTTPYYEQVSGVNVLKYGDGALRFNTKANEYDPLRYTTVPVANNTDKTSTPGGKRRSRHRKHQKSKRGSKRGGYKKTTHRKHKHTNRGRKARK